MLRNVHRLSLALVLCTLVLFAVGSQVGADGKLHAEWLAAHRVVGWIGGAIAVALLVALLIAMTRTKLARWLVVLGVAAVLGLGVQAAAGAALASGWTFPNAALAAAHATWPFCVFGTLALFTLGVSPAWNGAVPGIEDRGVPSLRSLALLAPASVLVQVVLGAAYRHEALSVMPHAAWAFVAILLILMFGMFVLTSASAPEHRPVRRVALALMTLIGVQLILGVLALVTRLDGVALLPPAAAGAIRAAHLTTGALVFALTLQLAAWVLRCAEPACDTVPAEADLARSSPR